MIHTKIISLRKSKLASAFEKNRLLIMLTFMFILGIILGAFMLARSTTVFELAKNSFQDYLDVRSNKPFWGVVASAFLGSLPIVLSFFLSGTSLVGVAISPLIISYVGFNYGIIAGYLYKQYLIIGVAFNALIYLPCRAICVIGAIIAAREAFNFSVRIVKISLPKGQAANIYNDFRIYSIRFFIIISVFIFAGIFDAGMAKLFLKYFNF